MEKEKMFETLKDVAKGLALMFGPTCETLVQDMSRPTHPVLFICNGHVSGRNIGSEKDIFGVEGQYEKADHLEGRDFSNNLVISESGQYIKTSSFVFENVSEGYHYALGVNFDFTALNIAANTITGLTNVNVEFRNVFGDANEDQLEKMFNECVQIVGRPVSQMKKNDRMRVVGLLYQRRAFKFQKSVQYVSTKLNVSRYTIYKYIHEIEGNSNLNRA